MQRMISSEDEQDKINNDIQVDVSGTRETNMDIKSRIGATDQARGDAITRLRILQGERDRKALSSAVS